MGACNVRTTCDDRRNVLSQVGRPKTGAEMATQLPVALVVGYGWIVVVLCYKREISELMIDVAVCIDSSFLLRPSATSDAQCRPPAHHAPRDAQAQKALDCRSSMIDCPTTMVQRVVRANQAMIDDVRFTRGFGSIALERRCSGFCAGAKRFSTSHIRWTLHWRMDSKRKHATADERRRLAAGAESSTADARRFAGLDARSS